MGIHDIAAPNLKVLSQFADYNKKSLFAIKKPNIMDSYLLKGYESYLFSLECLLETIIPEEFFRAARKDPTEEQIHGCFVNLHQSLPIIYTSVDEIDKDPDFLSVSILAQGEHTHGIGRFITDMLINWLVPGKQLPVEGQRAMNITFSRSPHQRYFLVENLVRIPDISDVQLIRKNLPTFCQETRQIILSVYRFRYLSSLSHFSSEQKAALLQENLSELLNGQNRDGEKSAFDQMHDFYLKFSAEKKLGEIKENLLHLMTKKPHNFDRDIFDAMHHLTILFKEPFTSIRDPRYVSRIVSYQYFFKKTIQNSLSNAPEKRHLYLKLFRTHLQNGPHQKKVLGILITLNFLNEIEHLDKKNILEALLASNFDIKYVENSYVADRSHDKVQSFYIEVEKNEGTAFSANELIVLKEKLKNSLENQNSYALNPIFFPKNEEEIMRNTILLSKQIRYVNDIPQVILSFTSQTRNELVFTAILLRVLKDGTPSLPELFDKTPSLISFSRDEVKIVGNIRNKYPKEANVCRLSLKKESFLRKDSSLDLQKAREVLVTELSKVIGDFRDLYGGLLFKQKEALENLKESLQSTPHSEFLLENFFYSIKPLVTISIMPTIALKELFTLFLDLQQFDFKQRHFVIKNTYTKEHFVLMLATISATIKDKIASDITELKLPSFALASINMELNGIHFSGYILRIIDQKVLATFQNVINSNVTSLDLF